MAPPDPLNSSAAPHLAELRHLRQRSGGFSETETNDVVQATRSRWAL
jgi:hypothetical protein